MKRCYIKILVFIILLAFSSCHFNIDIAKKGKLYFDDSTNKLIQKGSDAYLNGNYKLADSLLTIVIKNSSDKISITMPEEANPYFYRGTNNIELGRYSQALTDMEHVASDTTTNSHVLLVRCEALQMLKKYDSCIVICNRLISLKCDSVILISRGVCYFFKGQMDKACSDLMYCERRGLDTAYLKPFIKDCK